MTEETSRSHQDIAGVLKDLIFVPHFEVPPSFCLIELCMLHSMPAFDIPR